jgi:hypothetical protein
MFIMGLNELETSSEGLSEVQKMNMPYIFNLYLQYRSVTGWWLLLLVRHQESMCANLKILTPSRVDTV